MRSLSLCTILLAFYVSIVSLPLSADEAVEQWGRFELSFSAPATANPFVDVAFSATFEKDGQSFEPEGFYDGNDVFKIRFMPNEPGAWTYRTKSSDASLDGHTGSFTCTPASAGNHGPVGVREKFYFGYADGAPFRPYGTTIYEWSFQPEAEQQRKTLESLESAPFNKARFLVIPNYRKEYDTGGSLALAHFPFERLSRNTWDFSRFNPVFFQQLERNVDLLRDMGIQADLILFSPYDEKWGFDKMDTADDERYLRYVMARLASFRNVWWCMANEYDFIKNRQESDWDNVFQIVQANDPYDHLRSVENGVEIYDYRKPWVTHVALQDYMAPRYLGITPLMRQIYRKPIIYDELNYEGDVESRWGQLSSEEMSHRFWVSTIGGGYATHGETWRDETAGDGWISRGGTLTRQSPARIAFLKTIVDQSGLDAIEPIDQAFHPQMGGKAGRYYLVYLGKEQVESWPFVLPRDGLEPGMRFKVDVIDTWDMTVSPLEQTFEVERSDRYHFSDKKRQSIALPAKPYMALRIQRLVD